MTYDSIIKKLKSSANPKNVKGMARFGIKSKNSKILGVSVYEVRDLAKKIEKNHELARRLWNSKIHEARMLAVLIEEVGMVGEKQMERWVKDFDSWDLCDHTCSNLFDKTEFAYKKIFEWAEREEEFVKRAGFVLIAVLSSHDKKATDKTFEKFFPLIKKHSTDERNFARKAVNWALRGIGKRNINLNKKAIKMAKEIQKIDSRNAKWIAGDALRELENEKIKSRIRL